MVPWTSISCLHVIGFVEGSISSGIYIIHFPISLLVSLGLHVQLFWSGVNEIYTPYASVTANFNEKDTNYLSYCSLVLKAFGTETFITEDHCSCAEHANKPGLCPVALYSKFWSPLACTPYCSLGQCEGSVDSTVSLQCWWCPGFKPDQVYSGRGRCRPFVVVALL